MRKFGLALVHSAALSFFASAALGQSPPPAASSTPDAGLSEIVVTAQRREEKLKDVPITVTELSRDELTNAGITSVNELATLVSGLTITGNGNTSQPAIRGVSTAISGAGVENPNAVYIDGIYQVSQYALNADMPDIDRIEVLKGPQGTLFGRNATGGAIQIFTKNPSFTPRADLSVEEGAYTGSGSSLSSNHVKASLFGTLPLIDDLVATSIAVGFNRVNGYYRNDVSGDRDGLIETKIVRGKLLITPTSNFTIQGTGYWLYNEASGNDAYQPLGNLSSAAGLPGAIVPTQPYHEAYNLDFLGAPNRGDPNSNLLVQTGGNLKMTLDLAAGTLNSLTGYTVNDFKVPLTSVHGAYCPNTFTEFFQCLLTDGYIPQKETSQEINFISRDFGIASFTSGVFYYHGRGDSILNLQLDIPAFNASYDTKSYAAYSDVTLKATDALSFDAGARFTHEQHRDFDYLLPPPLTPFTTTNNKWTPRFTVKYAVTPDLNAYGTWSVGTKSGVTGATNSGIPVEPETLKSYEVGLKYATKAVSANVSAFHYDWKDLQVENFDGVNLNIRNADAKLYGLDGDLEVALSQPWRIRGLFSWLPHAEYTRFPGASYATPERNPATNVFYQDTDPTRPGFGVTYSDDLTGTRLIRAPKLTGSTTLAYDDELGNGRLDASTTVAFSSGFDQDLGRVVHQGSYATLLAQAGYRPSNGPLRFGLYGRNLANRLYQANSVESADGFLVTYAAPRELGVTVAYSFK